MLVANPEMTTIRKPCAIPLAAAVFLGALGACDAAAGAAVIASDRLPLMAEGGSLKADDKSGARLSRTFRFGTRGVYYVWLRVTSKSSAASLLTLSLDDVPPLKSARGKIPVQPSAASQWVSHSCYPEFNAEIHVPDPGEHTLHVGILYGEVEVEKIALTLFFGAKPAPGAPRAGSAAGDTLDHGEDPGGGRAVFPESPLRADGFRPDWQSPPVKSVRAFHVDAEKGSDAADGLSPATAWRSFARVNGREFKPGDAILLKRGCRWEEGLRPSGSGTPGKWITIGAYGDGLRPHVNGVNHDGVRLEEQSYWVIQDLRVTSDPAYGRCGIEVVTKERKVQTKGVRILNVIAYDNGPAGIHVGADHREGKGYDGVWIENCLAYYSDSDGIVVNGSDQNDCRNTVIRYCTAYSNLRGSGIYINGGQNGLIEHCVAYNNACINIWAWNAINITMRHCEAFRGRTPRDAGGFDIDWGCEACTMEYCYSHHNEGVGFLLMGHGEMSYRGFPTQSRYNLMRYCVSEDDNPGIGMVETFQFGKVHNNLVIATGKGRTALDVSGWPLTAAEDWGGGGWPSDTEYYNNILIGRNGGLPAWIDDYAATTNRNVFDYNLYHRVGSTGPLIRWGGRRNGPKFWEGDGKTGTYPPDDYSSLADGSSFSNFRRKTGQEAHGRFADPGFAAPYRGEYGRLPLESNALKNGSPVFGAGCDVPLTEEWQKGRAKYLTDTGAEAYGIPMRPAPPREDYRDRPLDSSGGAQIGPFVPGP